MSDKEVKKTCSLLFETKSAEIHMRDLLFELGDSLVMLGDESVEFFGEFKNGKPVKVGTLFHMVDDVNSNLEQLDKIIKRLGCP